MLRFKDFITVEYRPGEDELVNYRAYRRKRLSEEVEVEEIEVPPALRIDCFLVEDFLRSRCFLIAFINVSSRHTKYVEML